MLQKGCSGPKSTSSAQPVPANRTRRQRLSIPDRRKTVYFFRSNRAMPAVFVGSKRAHELGHIVSRSERHLRLIQRGAGQSESVQKRSAEIHEEQARKRAVAGVGHRRSVHVQVELALLFQGRRCARQPASNASDTPQFVFKIAQPSRIEFGQNQSDLVGRGSVSGSQTN